MRVAARESGTVSRTLFPVEEYVAATRSSTLSSNPFVLAQLVLSLAKEKPDNCFEIFGRSVKNIFQVALNKRYYFEFTKEGLINRGYTKSETIKYSIGWFVIIVGVIAIFNN